MGVEDPIERLRAVRRRMGAIKSSHEISYGILGVIGRTPPVVEERLVNFFAAEGTMVQTNVPGPRQVVTLAGTGCRESWSGLPARAGSG